MTKRASGVLQQSTSIKYLDIKFFVYGEISTKRLLQVCLPYEPYKYKLHFNAPINTLVSSICIIFLQQCILN